MNWKIKKKQENRKKKHNLEIKGAVCKFQTCFSTFNKTSHSIRYLLLCSHFMIFAVLKKCSLTFLGLENVTCNKHLITLTHNTGKQSPRLGSSVEAKINCCIIKLYFFLLTLLYSFRCITNQKTNKYWAQERNIKLKIKRKCVTYDIRSKHLCGKRRN